MFELHVRQTLDRLRPDDLVLDVGGWACPFNRANWVIDAESYETRGYFARVGGPASQGGPHECFSANTWVQQDICAGRWPFDNRTFDFAICSHTLEDVRDPLLVCAELIRVARAGYIEVPSRLIETCLGHERPNQAGLSHHRWLIEIADTHITFLPKYHSIHSSRRFHLPACIGRRLEPQHRVTWLWWNDVFTFEERTIHGVPAIEAELERFVDRYAPCPRWQKVTENAISWARALPQQFKSKGQHWLGSR
jgi:hypothetical protein